MFQAKKWSWKRVAANLLLVPVLAGGSVAVVHAQLGKGSGIGGTAKTTMPMTGTAASKPASAQTTTVTTSADPKQLLREGRRALDEGRFADAQDFAQAAERSNPSGKWGLFDDTPNALRKDIQAAKARADKKKAAELVKEAKALAAKKTATEAEYAHNLDTALQLARQADRLHGPYSSWDWSDRADKLIKELEAARAKLKVPAQPTGPNSSAVASTPTAPAAALSSPKGGNPNSSAVSGNKMPGPSSANTGTNDPKKATALKLLAEGRTLAERGDLVGAKAKFLEADKLGASFSATEFNPGFALQDLRARGAEMMDRSVRDAQAAIAAKNYAQAHQILHRAAEMASGLGLYLQPVTEAKAALYLASGGQFGAPSPSGITSAGGPEHLIPANPVGSTTPALPPGTATVYGKKPETAPTDGTATARQLLNQAAYEFQKGEFDIAEKLAQQAHNQGLQEEARALLNSIDAEKFRHKQRSAVNAIATAKAALEKKDYERAFNVLILIEPKLLPAEAQASHTQMLAACKAELDKARKTDVIAVGGQQPSDGGPLPPAAKDPPGTAQVNPSSPPSQTADTLRSLQVQKLHAEGLEVQEKAQKAFGRGETDLAMQLLIDYAQRVRASGLPAGTVNQLLRSVEGRLETFRMLKGQADAIARQNKDKREARELINNRGVAEEERKRDVAQLVRQFHDLMKKSDYAAAERVALQAKQLDPDDPAVSALYEMAKMTKRIKEAERDKAAKESFFLEGLNDNDRMGPYVSTDNPVAIKLEAMERIRRRGSLDDAYLKTRSQAEYEIEMRLQKPISVDFHQTPLDQAIENLKTLTNLPLQFDRRSMAEEQISEVQPITVNPGTPVAAKNILAFILEQAGLGYVIEHDMVKITTLKKAKGRMVTKVFSVADLVTPVPNFALPDYANLAKALRNPMHDAIHNASSPYTPRGGLGGGVPVNSPLVGELATTPAVHMPGLRQGGTLQANPVGDSANVTEANNTKHEQLIKLITSMVRPHSWDAHGGPGKLQYFEIGHALVVNQTADVISEIQDLLEALRRLQDLAVAVEVRIVSLSEAFFERMGLDFSVNIKTNTTKFEPALTSGIFRPEPFINDINHTGVTVGLTPAGTFTPDLDVPIRATSFQRAIPGFGGFPNQPGDQGGIALGLAFLNDIQVYTLLEMAQGDRRFNIMQAPKLTLFNGQTSTLAVSDLQFFLASITVTQVNGQLVFIPNNTPLPVGVNITIQTVVSADRRFVRLNLPVTFTTNFSANVPLFPFTTFIIPVFEGGSQGQPVPFTQFLQQPGFTTVNIQTTVVCPDGGTVLLGGLKTLSENRNEFGPPFLSKIPYINRLFKNVGVGRESAHVMIMVTPRIIINSEEEIFQTEGRLPGEAR
ncbi:MAG: hypothetical protein RMJ56_16830 [Gemmataceae bacterium]|nr:hypothetical protein [Gemmata sp.]MDW8199264.1 hypothetical protein [Gemmataceae bacterium]